MMDDPDYNRLWQALGHDPTGMDRLVERTGLTTAELSSMLLVMELDGRIAVEHGRYARKRHDTANRSEEHTSELQSLMRISYAVFCLQKTQQNTNTIIVG